MKKFASVNLKNAGVMRSLFVLVLLYLLTGCKSSQSVSGENVALETNFQVSANTKIFLADLLQEMNDAKSETLVPSAQLIEKYGIIKSNDQYFIHGFIKTDSSFNGELLKRNGATVQSTSGNIKTILVNLKSLPSFLKQKGITYFEIGNKLSLSK